MAQKHSILSEKRQGALETSEKFVDSAFDTRTRRLTKLAGRLIEGVPVGVDFAPEASNCVFDLSEAGVKFRVVVVGRKIFFDRFDLELELEEKLFHG